MSTDLVRSATDQRRCALYRHFDDADVLLYVGITDNLGDRTNSGHARTSDWVQYAERAEAEWWDSRELAGEAEREAVRDDRPVFNRQYAAGDVDGRIADYLHAREVRALNDIISSYEVSVERFLETVPTELLAHTEEHARDLFSDFGHGNERTLPAFKLQALNFLHSRQAANVRRESALATLQEVLDFIGKRAAEIRDPWSVPGEPPF